MPYRFVGYAIISEDGMLADAMGVIPPSLVVKADQDFFMRGLDDAAALVHGRNSAEQPTSPSRRRLIATRSIASLAPSPDQPNALLWNPNGIAIEDALAEFGIAAGDIAIIGGTDIFGAFLPRYDAFHLTRAPDVMLPGGRPVFPGIPATSPEALLQDAGLVTTGARRLDPQRGITVTSWQRKV